MENADEEVLTLEVVVPVDAHPGETFEAETAGGLRFSVTVPEGVEAGATLAVSIPPDDVLLLDVVVPEGVSTGDVLVVTAE